MCLPPMRAVEILASKNERLARSPPVPPPLSALERRSFSARPFANLCGRQGRYGRPARTWPPIGRGWPRLAEAEGRPEYELVWWRDVLEGAWALLLTFQHGRKLRRDLCFVHHVAPVEEEPYGGEGRVTNAGAGRGSTAGIGCRPPGPELGLEEGAAHRRTHDSRRRIAAGHSATGQAEGSMHYAKHATQLASPAQTHKGYLPSQTKRLVTTYLTYDLLGTYPVRQPLAVEYASEGAQGLGGGGEGGGDGGGGGSEGGGEGGDGGGGAAGGA
eukprot:scaffold392_cov60-Phaeocystis_antarctica.AAC.3